ncbi:hypothetical protein IGI04_038604 [Brassica rapa subsp. trilocularis]|uniref:Reverse transcriptase zinc-binding domain-containing protein n=1 Tax=Brassica rapa subsp. trilocularis TaxID=1813537 RepID=A0ABQ7LNH3_BRACM|nr:hypothetical protein IGI04_038604 [Brassica rapa subsp. trilocularis]
MSINISFWNVRGINGKDKHPDFLNWRNVNKVSFGAILESHVKESNLSIVMNAICPGWSFASNHSEDEDGRIIIFWKHPLQVSVLLKTRQSLTCFVHCPGSHSFTVTAFFNYLVTHPDFQETVTSGWEFTSSDSWNLSSLSKKQKQLKKYLKSLNKDNFSDIQKRKILRLRHLAVRWLKILPGNGRECRFWTSPWSPFGQLINFVGQSGPRSTGIPISSSLASLWSNDSWTLAPARSDRMEEVLTYLTSISLSDRPDTMIWNTSTTRSNQSRCFSANQVYNLIRESNPSVAWKNVVWLKRGIPKFKTLTWLFVLDRCPTRNRLLAWGLQTDAGCLLCNRYQESRDHLFFDCEYSYAIWGSLATRLNFSLQSNSWNDSLQALIDFTGDSTLRYLIILAWQASIYEIWKERNNRLHRNIFRSPSSLVSSINATVKNRISSFRDDNGVFSSQTMQRWLSTN